uniref:BTB domain-containing protein n=1 Tax=Meloidogyne incognita TaxID=6306 RepID=A0A914N338_MELIC
MLEFFYSGTVSDDKMKSHVDDIFAIAHKYQVEMLKCLCERFMSSDINNENMVKYCGIINLYDTPILEKACTDYIRVNGKNFLKSKEWEEIKNNYQSVVPRFLESIVENLDK